ncbi:MAG TPA: 1,4-alpha-glucan branching protein domain-containing protein [Candidatus Eisenbacteria bacterium]
MTQAGSFTFVLHSHLPWVLNHGRWPHGVDWLNEATVESYLPLWQVLRARAAGGRSLGVTLGMTPVLCEQLAHPAFHRELVDYLNQKIGAAVEDRKWFTRSGENELAALAERWERAYRSSLEDLMGPHGPNLVARFRRLEEQGAIEVITSGASHAYLPLVSSDLAVAGQVRTARVAHRRHFGRDPRGIWLPECAYRPAGTWPSPQIEAAGGGAGPPRQRRGIEEILADQGIRYFFVDSHLLAGGRPLGVYADRFEALRHLARDAGEPAAAAGGHPPYRPYRVGPRAAASCFGRDPATALQVWSGEHGYPGDPVYLDFHKKRFPGGHRYWSVTHPKADLAHKQVYRPGAAEARCPEHAAHFIALLERTLQEARRLQSASPVVCAMYDTELFGHWWFEGPRFLGEVLDLCDRGGGVAPMLPSRYLELHPPDEVVSLPEGSWGDGGGHQVWLNPETRWTWAPVHAAEARFAHLTHEAAARPRDPLLDRLLSQAGREMMLLESSDWQFLITTFSARDYAELRVTEHAEAFERLASLAERRGSGGALGEADEHFLSEIERRDDLFPDFDWRAYAAPLPDAVGVAG